MNSVAAIFASLQRRRLTLARSMSSSPRPLRTALSMNKLKPLACSKLTVGGMESSWRLTTTSTRAGPSCSRAWAIIGFTVDRPNACFRENVDQQVRDLCLGHPGASAAGSCAGHARCFPAVALDTTVSGIGLVWGISTRPLRGGTDAEPRLRSSHSADADLTGVEKGAVPVSSHPPSSSANASADRFLRLACAATARAADRSSGLPSVTT